MAVTTTSGIPSEIRAGDSYAWTVSLPLFSADDGYTASIIFTSPGQDRRNRLDSATVSGSLFDFALSSADSGNYSPPGTWAWVLISENEDGERATHSYGTIGVLEDLTAYEPADTHAARMVRALESRMEGRINDDTENVTYNGVSVSQIPIAECERLMNRYRAELSMEIDRDRKRRGQPARGPTSRINLKG